MVKQEKDGTALGSVAVTMEKGPHKAGVMAQAVIKTHSQNFSSGIYTETKGMCAGPHPEFTGKRRNLQKDVIYAINERRTEKSVAFLCSEDTI